MRTRRTTAEKSDGYGVVAPQAIYAHTATTDEQRAKATLPAPATTPALPTPETARTRASRAIGTTKPPPIAQTRAATSPTAASIATLSRTAPTRATPVPPEPAQPTTAAPAAAQPARQPPIPTLATPRPTPPARATSATAPKAPATTRPISTTQTHLPLSVGLLPARPS